MKIVLELTERETLELVKMDMECVNKKLNNVVRSSVEEAIDSEMSIYNDEIACAFEEEYYTPPVRGGLRKTSNVVEEQSNENIDNDKIEQLKNRLDIIIEERKYVVDKLIELENLENMLNHEIANLTYCEYKKDNRRRRNKISVSRW